MKATRELESELSTRKKPLKSAGNRLHSVKDAISSFGALATASHISEAVRVLLSSWSILPGMKRPHRNRKQSEWRLAMSEKPQSARQNERIM